MILVSEDTGEKLGPEGLDLDVGSVQDILDAVSLIIFLDGEQEGQTMLLCMAFCEGRVVFEGEGEVGGGNRKKEKQRKGTTTKGMIFFFCFLSHLLPNLFGVFSGAQKQRLQEPGEERKEKLSVVVFFFVSLSCWLSLSTFFLFFFLGGEAKGRKERKRGEKRQGKRTEMAIFSSWRMRAA